MKSFKIFSGRYILRILIAMPIAWFVCFGAGFGLGSVAGYFSPDEDVSITEEAEEKEGFADGFMESVYCMLGGITVIATTGTMANFMFRVEGSKYVRTIRNGHKHFIKAYVITASASVISAIISSAALIVVSGLLTEEGVQLSSILHVILCAALSAFIANIICTAMLFIRNNVVRSVGIVATMLLPMVVSLMLSMFADIGVIILCTVLGAILFGAALYVSGTQIKKRWLFD